MARTKVTTRSSGTGVSTGFQPSYVNPLRAKRLGMTGSISEQQIPLTAQRIEFLHQNVVNVAEQLEDLYDEIWNPGGEQS